MRRFRLGIPLTAFVCALGITAPAHAQVGYLTGGPSRGATTRTQQSVNSKQCRPRATGDA